jgi:hypothetical protein
MVIGRQFIRIVMMAGIALAQTFEAASVRRAPPDNGLGMNHVAETRLRRAIETSRLGVYWRERIRRTIGFTGPSG